MSVNTDVLIIGGGVVGSACAWEFQRAGRSVTVVDPGGTAGVGWQAAAGLLAPQVEAGPDSPLLGLGLAGREYYATHAELLQESTGIDIALRLSGILHLAGSEAEADELREKVAWQRQHGLYCDWLSDTEVEEGWPWLSRVAGALLAPNDGQLDPAKLVQALIVDGNRLGVRRVEDQIRTLRFDGRRLVAAEGSERYSAAMVILAAGAWTGRIDGLPRPVSVEPIRGQMIAMPRPRSLEEFTVYGRGAYLLTRGEEVIAGSTMEHAGFVPDVTDEGVRGIKSAADGVCPVLAETGIARSWAGLRPGTPDGLPIIGPEPRVDGLWYATGHGRNGVLLAGITAVMLLQLLAGEATLEPATPFRPERFWER